MLQNEHLDVDNDTNILHIVPLGKTGSGKSSLANTIFGEKRFSVGHFASSETKTCDSKTKEVNGRNLRLVDSPGLFDTDQNDTEISPKHVTFLLECAPEIHAFLILLKIEKFTKQEKEVIDSILKTFAKDALKYSTVVFTHGDQLPEGMKIEEWVEANDGVKNLVQNCGGRVHVFDNKYWNNSQDPYRNNQVQINNLLKTIEETVRNNGGRGYTNKALLEFEREIQQAMSEIDESSPGEDPGVKRQKAKKIAEEKIWPKIKHVTVGSVLGLLVGGVALGALCVFIGAITGAVAVGGTVVSGIVGGLAGQIHKQKKIIQEEEQKKKED